MAGYCPKNAWSKKVKSGFRGKECLCVGRGRGQCFGCGEEGHYVAQCLKASPRKCFLAGKFDICYYTVEEDPCVLIAASWITRHHGAKN